MSDYWRQMADNRRNIIGLTVQAVETAINARPPGPPIQADDSLFAALTDQTVIAIGQSDYRHATDLFDPCYRIALEYEARHGRQIHKGAPCFNVGVAYLRNYDYPAAMHYFELAQYESQVVSGDDDWNIYRNELFERNFWDTLDAAANTYPLQIYQDLWNVPFNKTAAMADWDGLSEHSKTLYILANAQRIRYRQLATRSNWDGSDSMALLYWTLAADFGRILETELKHRTGDTRTLHPLLSNNLAATPAGNLSAEFGRLHGIYGVNNPTSYNAAFPTIRRAIENPALTHLERIGHAVYLLYATRNQVAHQVDIGMELFTQPESTRFTSDVLLSLCRLADWIV
jgi:hypothetical protein